MRGFAMNTTEFFTPLPSDDDALIRADKLPSCIGIAQQTLARWRTEGQGPAFVKVGRLGGLPCGRCPRVASEAHLRPHHRSAVSQQPGCIKETPLSRRGS